ncbi:MAG: MATE family efflux transporter [Dehalococcoidia bacterium]|nr:MATE family efflux transporter [Dehalococcoidia bacterium]
MTTPLRDERQTIAPSQAAPDPAAVTVPGQPPPSPDTPPASPTTPAAAGAPGPTGIAAELDDNRAIRRTVFGLAWPVIVENLLQTAVGMVDLLMVSRLGAAAIAGVGIGTQVLFVVFMSIGALAISTTALVARRTGEEKPAAASRVLKQSVLLALVAGVLLALFGVPAAESLVRLLGADPEVVTLGGSYIRITFLFSGTLVASFVLGAGLRGAGDTRTPMLAAVLINVVNIALDYVLIFGHLGFPALGVLGSAWAAAIGRTAGAGALALLLLRPASIGRLSLLGRDGWRPDFPILTRLVRIGVPSFIEGLSRSLGFLMFSTIVLGLGTTVFAAQRVVFSLMSLSFMPGFAFGIAASALTGQALGAKRPDRARRSTWFAVRSAMLWMGSLAVLFFFAGPWLMLPFTNDQEIVSVGSAGLKVLAFGQPFFACSMVLAGALRGAGDTRFPMLIAGLGMWAVRLPLAWWFALGLGGGLPGAFASFALGSAVEATIMTWRYRRGRWADIKV